MNENNFPAARVQIDLVLPPRASSEIRLTDARTLLAQLSERTFDSMSALDLGDQGRIEYADAEARFRVHIADPKPDNPVYKPSGTYCSVCDVHDRWCAHIRPPKLQFTQVVVTYTIHFYDGLDTEAKGLVGVFPWGGDVGHVAKARERAEEWWRLSAEQYDCVSKVVVEFSPIGTDGFAAPFDLMVERTIYDEMAKKV